MAQHPVQGLGQGAEHGLDERREGWLGGLPQPGRLVQGLLALPALRTSVTSLTGPGHSPRNRALPAASSGGGPRRTLALGRDGEEGRECGMRMEGARSLPWCQQCASW